jgi:Ca-activated chloride channel homolog
MIPRLCWLGAALLSALGVWDGSQPPKPRHPAILQGDPGAARGLEIAFDRATRTVTVTLSIEDPDGVFIPNLRPENFVVHEDGVRQKQATVDVDHASVTLSIVLEGGSRYLELNNLLTSEIPYVSRPLSDALLPSDRVGVFSYADHVQTLVDFGQPRDRLNDVISQFTVRGFSEAKLYDALVDVLHRTAPLPGRKAVLLISTGLDTFSHTSFEDLLAEAQRSTMPVYCYGLAGTVKRTLVVPAGPLAKIDWDRASTRLKALSKATHGRTYLRDADLDAAAVYDDMLDDLRVRYVIKYVSSNPGATGHVRTVKVTLVDPLTGGPLRIVDSAGKAVTAKINLQGSYTP